MSICCGDSAAKPIWMFCGRGNVTDRRVILLDEEVKLAHVTVSTKALCKPHLIKIEFSNNIRYEEFDPAVDPADTKVRYDLYRRCGDEEPLLLDSWVYQRRYRLDADEEFLSTTDIVSFHYCDCEIACKECCVYYVVATTEILNNGIVTYLKAEMSALVQEVCDHDYVAESSNNQRYVKY